jgi:hypothetical protein
MMLLQLSKNLLHMSKKLKKVIKLLLFQFIKLQLKLKAKQKDHVVLDLVNKLYKTLLFSIFIMIMDVVTLVNQKKPKNKSNVV